LEQGGELEEEIKLPKFEHQDLEVAYPSSANHLPKRVATGPHATAFFDGGAAKKLGTGGYIVFDAGGCCLTA
jgi:hypothetical protein